MLAVLTASTKVDCLVIQTAFCLDVTKVVLRVKTLVDGKGCLWGV